MTLYYSMVFGLLVFEMIVFIGLIIPMPYRMKRRIFTFISESRAVAKLQYGIKITFMFILVLFIDSVNRVYRVQVELAATKEKVGVGAGAMGSERMEVQVRKFYSQRNMYLCGFTLFLSLILNRTYTMILDVLRLEEKLQMYEGSSKAGGKQAQKLNEAGDLGQIGELRKQITKKDKEIDALKSQSEGLRREYDELSVKYNQTNPDHTPKKDR